MLNCVTFFPGWTFSIDNMRFCLPFAKWKRGEINSRTADGYQKQIKLPFNLRCNRAVGRISPHLFSAIRSPFHTVLLCTNIKECRQMCKWKLHAWKRKYLNSGEGKGLPSANKQREIQLSLMVSLPHQHFAPLHAFAKLIFTVSFSYFCVLL